MIVLVRDGTSTSLSTGRPLWGVVDEARQRGIVPRPLGRPPARSAA